MRRWLPVVVLGLAQFVMVVDTTAMNVSLSTVVADLGTTVPALQLAIAGYTLVMAMFMLPGAALGQRWGRRRALVTGLVVYATGSLLSALAPDVVVLVLGWSVLEGLGAALVVPSLSAIVATTYEGHERAMAFGLLGGIAGAAAATGPIIGGWLTEVLSWRVIFGGEVVLVAVLLVLVLVVEILPDDRPAAAAPFDLVGAALSAAGVGAVVTALARSGAWGWVRPSDGAPVVLGLSATLPVMAAGLALLLAFQAWQVRRTAAGATTLLDPALLRVRTLRAGLSTVLVQQLVLAGTFFVIPLHLQMVLGLGPLEAGTRLLPLSMTVLVVALVGGRLAARVAPRRLVRVGLATTCAGVLAAATTVGPTLREPAWFLAMAVMGAGVGLVASQVGNVVQSSVPVVRSSEAGGLLGTAQNLGASVGTALVGSVLLLALAQGFGARVAGSPQVDATTDAVVAERTERGVDFVTLGTARAAAEAAGLQGEEADAVVEAYADAQLTALRGSLALVGLVALGGLLVTAGLPTTPLAGRRPATGAPAAAPAGVPVSRRRDRPTGSRASRATRTRSRSADPAPRTLQEET